MLATFSLVLGSAYLIVEKSITSDTSNIKVIAAFVRKEIQTANALDAVTPSQPASQFVPQQPCARIGIFPADDSLVEFLDSEGKDSSYENRNVIAVNAGISDYIGSNEQNIEIINHIIRRESIGEDCPKR